MAENEVLRNEEKKLFFNKIGLIDTSNVLLDCGLENYLKFISYVKSFDPKKIIQIIDARTPYTVRDKFGAISFKKLIQLIKKQETLKIAPARTESDTFLIQAAVDNPNHFLLSNDKFANYSPIYTKTLNLVKFMFIDSKFYFSLNLKDSPEDEVNDTNQNVQLKKINKRGIV